MLSANGRNHLWERYHSWMGAAFSGILIAMCYGFALRLPFFFDDLPVMTWVNHHDLVDMWTMSSENAYYRPLTFTVYKLGSLLPLGSRQAVLHAINLILYWSSATLVAHVTKLCGGSPEQGFLASTLFTVFPFMFLAIPWITAMPHVLATALTLLAVYAALRAERDNLAGWWGISFLATILAPFSHESGQMCGAIVGGLVLIQHGLRDGRRRVVGVVLGGLLSVAVLLLRSRIPGVSGGQLAGLGDSVQNSMFFLDGLLYPIAPIVGWLVHRKGGHDFTLILLAALLMCLLMTWLARRDRDWHWVARGLWWWLCGALPAAASIRYGKLYISPRLHALASVGTVMLWAHVVNRLGKVMRRPWGQRLVWIMLGGAIVTQNVAFLHRQKALFRPMHSLYQQVLGASDDKSNAPLGFVNLPSSLAWPTKTYALIQETVVFIPRYSNLGEFIEVNKGWRASDAVMFSPVLQKTQSVFGFQGSGIGWEEMRHYAIEHRTVWLSRHVDGRFRLNEVGSITSDASPSFADPLAEFEGGPTIESASARESQNGHWAITVNWLASGPVSGHIFVHVVDADESLVAQADGPALGGMVPIWLWESGDRIRDVRHITLPEGPGPFTVQVGVFDAEGRFPALARGLRYPDDAATITEIIP